MATTASDRAEVIRRMRAAADRGDDDMALQLATVLRRMDEVAPPAPQTRSEKYAANVGEMPVAEQALRGAGAGVDVLGMGLSSGLVDPYREAITGRPTSPETQDERFARVDEIRKAQQENPAFGIGRLGSEIGMIAAPGSAGTRMARAVAPKLTAGGPRVTPLASDVAATSAVTAAQQPGAGESRLLNAADAGVSSLVGGGIGVGIGKALQGANVTPVAREVLDEGGYLTPGQAAESKGVQVLERAANITPFISRAVRPLRREGFESWGQSTLRRAAPEGMSDKITASGHEGFRQLEKIYDDGYRAAWSKARPLKEDFVNSTAKTVKRTSKRVGKRERRVLTNVLSDARQALESGDPKSIENLDDFLRNEISRVGRKGKNSDLHVALTSIRRRLREQLPQTSQHLISKLDESFGAFKTVQRSTAKALTEEGVFSPSELVSSVKRTGGEARVARGEAHLQPWAAGSEDIGTLAGGNPILQFMTAFASGPPAPRRTIRGVGRAIIGETAPQRAMSRMLASSPVQVVEAAGVRPAVLAGAAGGPDQTDRSSRLQRAVERVVDEEETE